MTRTASRQKAKRKNIVARAKPRKQTSDRAIYLGLIVIGFFAVMLASLFTEFRYAGVFAAGYVALIAYLINFYTFHIYRGAHLANWQQALARVPLRFVGYGTKDGKPLEAAHHHPETRKALLACIAISAVVVAVLGFIAWRSAM